MSTNPIQAAWPLKRPQQLVYVELGPHNGGMMLGVCELGLTFRAVAPLKADGLVPFSFALDGKARLQGLGEIAWTEEDGKTGGLKFTNVTPEFRDSLRVWLAAESTPKIVGRETTPAAALPLDSIEKIKSHIREGRTEEIRATVSALRFEEKLPQVQVNECKTIESKSTEAAAVDTPANPLPSLAKFRFPFAPVPVPPVSPPAINQEPLPAPATIVHLEAEKEYPPLPGLHQPYAHIPPGEQVEEDTPQLNRAAAAGIIALALVVILVALVLSFRREVGETLIRLGERLAGEMHAPTVLDPRSESNRAATAPTPAVPPSVANNAPTQTLGTDKPTNTQPAASLSNTPQTSAAAPPSQSAKIQRVEDLPLPTDLGYGQKEFDQAREILRGEHRQRDLSSAVDLLWTGVRKGYVPAEVTLADLYARGDGVERSCEQARVLLQAAIQKGSPEARRRLVLLRQQGCG